MFKAIHSLEMEIPKILWLKTHMPAAVFQSCMFFDLPDYLTYRATGSYARSNCSLACKCSYVPPGVKGSKGWNDAFFNEIGLEEFVSRLHPYINFPSLQSVFHHRFLLATRNLVDSLAHRLLPILSFSRPVNLSGPDFLLLLRPSWDFCPVLP